MNVIKQGGNDKNCKQMMQTNLNYFITFLSELFISTDLLVTHGGPQF